MLVDPICACFSDMLQVHKLQSKDLKKKRNVKEKESEMWVLMRRARLDSCEEG